MASSDHSSLDIPGVVRRKDLFAILIDPGPECELLKSAFSAAAVPCRDVYDECGAYALGPTLDSVLAREATIWDTTRRQLAVIGDLSNARTSHLSLLAHAQGFETFAGIDSSGLDGAGYLAVQRLILAGVSPIAVTHLIEEIMRN